MLVTVLPLIVYQVVFVLDYTQRETLTPPFCYLAYLYICRHPVKGYCKARKTNSLGKDARLDFDCDIESRTITGVLGLRKLQRSVDKGEIVGV